MPHEDWSINYYKSHNGKEPVKQWIDKDLAVSAKAKLFKAFELLQKHGIDLGMPYVKPIRSKLYELRVKDQNGIYRVLYFANTGKEFILLHGFTKKTNKTPKQDIEIALKRKKEFSNG